MRTSFIEKVILFTIFTCIHLLSFGQCNSLGCSICKINAKIETVTGATVNIGSTFYENIVDGPGNITCSPLEVTAIKCGEIKVKIKLKFEWNGGSSSSWVHGISFSNSSGWSVAVGIPPSDKGWIFMPNGISGICSGKFYGTGYYYDPPGTICGNGPEDPNQSNYSSFNGVSCTGLYTNSSEAGNCYDEDTNFNNLINDGDPSDNWGSNCTTNCPEFGFSLSFKPTIDGTQTETITFKLTEDGETGGWANSNNCNYTVTIPIKINSASIEVIPPVVKDTSYCYGQPIPHISATSQTGLQVNWYNKCNGNLLKANSQIFSPPNEGVYAVRAINPINNCFSDCVTFKVMKKNSPNIICNTISDALSPESNSGKVEVNIIEGIEPFNIHWSGPQMGNLNQYYEKKAEISSLTKGNYDIIVTSANGCFDTCRFNILECNDALDLEHKNLYLCSDNSISISPKYLNETGIVYWKGPNNFFSNMPFITVKDTGTYYIQYNYGTNCINKDSIIILKGHIPVSKILATPSSILDCKVTQIKLTNSFDTTEISSTWKYNGNENMAEFLDIEETGVFVLIVTDVKSGCTSKDSITISYNDNKINAVNDTVFLNGNIEYVYNFLKNDIYPQDYIINIKSFPDKYIKLTNLDSNGIAKFNVLKENPETLTAEYLLCNKCDTCVIGKILFIDERLKEITQVTLITPKESANNRLQFSKDPIPGMEVWVYNRWGQQVYHSKDYQNDWDASGYAGGVYYYVLKVYGLTIKKTLTVVK